MTISNTCRLLAFTLSWIPWLANQGVTQAPLQSNQAEFDRVRELNLEWSQLQEGMKSLRDSLAVTALTPLPADSNEMGLIQTLRSYVRHGESVTWYLSPAALGAAAYAYAPELWVDGHWVGSGWNVPLHWVAGDSSDLTSIEVRGGTTSSNKTWGKLIPLKTLCTAPAPDLPPWPAESSSNPWWVGTFYEGTPVTGMAVTRFSPDGLFDKPLLVVEGFDPDLTDEFPSYGYGTMNWDAIWNCNDLAYPNTTSMPLMFDSLLHMGFDLVYLDFQDGTREVAAQAALLGAVLDRIAVFREESEPFVIVGASMGGVISRIALRERELLGIEDCVSHFITLDTPHRGAYLPLALQEAVAFFSSFNPNAASLLEALNSPAAREMLFITPDGPTVEHGDMLSHLAELSWPQGPRCLAISNGHSAIPVDLNGGALIQGGISSWGVDWAQVQLWPCPGDPYHSASTSGANVIFDCSIPNLNGDWWNDLVYESTAWCSPSSPAWDGLAGSTSPHIQALQVGLEGIGFDLTSMVSATSFVHVPSALDEPNGNPSIVKRMEPIGSAPASHCDLTGHVDYVLAFVLEGTAWDGPSQGDAMGHPHWGFLQAHRLYMGEGTLGQGMTWTIGTPSGNGSLGADWPRFDVKTAPCVGPLIIESGGSLLIGDAAGNGTGSLSIGAGNVLELRAGGELQLGPGSRIVVENGGTLIMNGGDFNCFEGAELVLELGGQIQVVHDTQWSLPSEFTWEWDGRLSVAAGVEFELNPDWNCHVNWSGVLSVEEHAEWILSPIGAFCNIEVLDDACMIGQGGVRWFDVNLNFDANAHLNAFCKQRWTRVNAWGNSFNEIHCTSRWRWHEGNASALTIFHEHVAEADPFWRALHATGITVQTNTSTPYISNCQFEHSTWSSNQPNGGTWRSCAWAGQGNETALIVSEAAHPIRLDSCSFYGYETGFMQFQGEAVIQNSSWTDCETAIELISTQATVVNGENGGCNYFANNGFHCRWINAPWWECSFGNNQFQEAWQAPFSGEVLVENTGGASTWLLDARGNQWFTTEGLTTDLLPSFPGILELMLSPVALETGNCNEQVIGEAVDSSPKALHRIENKVLSWEPPTQDGGRLELYNAIGQHVHRTEVPSGIKVFLWNLTHLPSGGYALIWVPNDMKSNPESEFIWISHQ